MHVLEDDGTPSHLKQLDEALVAGVVAKLKAMPLGYGGRLELNAFAETRTIHDGRRLLNLLRFMVDQPDHAAMASAIVPVIAELEAMLPKGG